MGNFQEVQGAPLSGYSFPPGLGLDTETPSLAICGKSNEWVSIQPDGAVGVDATDITAAATIAPTAKVSYLSGTTEVTTITPPPGMVPGGSIVLIPITASGQSTGTGGNIAVGSTLVQYQALTLTWDGTSWYPSYT